MNKASPPTILIIDDEAAIRESFVEYLLDRDFYVLTAESGTVGLEILKRERPDLVMTDLRMPDSDGLDVLRKAGELFPETPVLVVSGTGRITDSIQALRLGAWDYILKPVTNMEIVLHAVNRALERAQLLKERREHHENLERKVAERTKELEQANAKLISSESRFRDLAEMLPEAIFEADADMNLSYVNQRVLDLFGYSKRDLAQGFNGFNFLIQTDRDTAHTHALRCSKGKPCGSIEYAGKRKDDSAFPILLHLSPIYKEQHFSGFRGVIVDLSKRKIAEDDKKKLEEKYYRSQKMESIGRLAGGVAHDLNNLLTPILGYSQMLEDEFSLDDTRRTSVKQIFRAGIRGRDLVRQLLAFSRKQTLEYKTLNLNTVISDFEKLLRRTIKESITFKIELAATLRSIKADVGQIEQVIMNLAINAADALSDSGTLTLKTSMQEACFPEDTDQAGPCVVLTVQDNGCGMDAYTKENIFEPFFSTKGEQGTGLGLATVYGIIKQHGGNIVVHSELNQGTSFEIFLPICKETAIEVVEDTRKTLKFPKSASETILLVEDSEQVRELAHDILKLQGYAVLIATCGPEALEILSTRGSDIDLMLTDIVMPEMNGKVLFEKASQMYPKLKVLYMSGYADDVIDPSGVLDQGRAFLPKPFTVLGLTTKIREVLGEKE